MPKYEDLTGKTFGYLEVLEYAGTYGSNQSAHWRCKCHRCGIGETILSTNELKHARVKSCGCLSKDTSSIVGKQNVTHGETGTRLYQKWSGMKRRCYNPNESVYPSYGGRGITVCDEWKNSYINFRDWALSNGYNDNLTIERKDVNGNYEPDNCTWISFDEQRKNKRDTIRYEGKCLKDVCRERNLKYGTVWFRIKCGKSIEDALY